MAHRIFVYGTLKRGFPNHRAHMANSLYIGSYQTHQAYPLVIAGPYFIPCLLPEPGIGLKVRGEIFEVDDTVLALLDKLESTDRPDGYRRQAIQVQPLNITGDSLNEDMSTAHFTAHVYCKRREHLGTIHSPTLATYPRDPRYIPALDRS